VTAGARAVWAVLPVKAFDAAKSRLAGALGPDERRALTRRLMLTALDALLASRALAGVLVVSAEPEALALARRRGAAALPEAAGGLNQALSLARRAAMARGAAALLVMPADLPLVGGADVRGFLEAAAAADVAIVPDRRRSGTNALLLRPPGAITFAFGEGSFERHLALAAAAGFEPRVVDVPAIAFDLDTADDLADLRNLPYGLAAAGGLPVRPKGRGLTA